MVNKMKKLSASEEEEAREKRSNARALNQANKIAKLMGF